MNAKDLIVPAVLVVGGWFIYQKIAKETSKTISTLNPFNQISKVLSTIQVPKLEVPKTVSFSYDQYRQISPFLKPSAYDYGYSTTSGQEVFLTSSLLTGLQTNPFALTTNYLQRLFQ